MSRTREKSGFTLVELLVVIAIIGVLIALLLPAVQAAREAARRSQCSNNLKQIGLALQNHHDVNKRFPSGSMFRDRGAGGPSGSNRTTWMTRILPHIEQGVIYDQLDYTQDSASGWDPNNMRNKPIAGFRCPSDPGVKPNSGYEPTSYVGCIGKSYRLDGNGGSTAGSSHGTYIQGNGTWARMVLNNGSEEGVFAANSKCRLRDITDGTSNTMAVSECLVGSPVKALSGGDAGDCDGSAGSTANTRGYSWAYGDPDTWTYSALRTPNSRTADCDRWAVYGNMAAKSQHPTGVQVALADGSVRFVTENINLQTWRDLSQRNDGNVLGEY